MQMLRTGIYLFSSSTLGFFYHCADLAYSMSPALRWFCLSGLFISLVCFVATYLGAYTPGALKAFARQPHMIKSTEWKTSPQA